MRFARRFASVAIGAVLVVSVAPSAHAGTLSISDASNDVRRVTFDFEMGEPRESAAHEPTVDVLAVDVDNRLDRLEVVVHVAEALSFDDDQWDEAFDVDVTVRGPSGDADSWRWSVDPAGPAGVLERVDGSSCETAVAVDTASDTYTFVADDTCARALPRTLRIGVGIVWDQSDPADFDSFELVVDQAPDDDVSAPVAAAGAAELQRLAGPDRVATAVALSEDRYDDAEAAGAVLASGDTHPDALAGAPLAVARRGPLLLTRGAALDPRVAAELRRALPVGSEVTILGGTASVPSSVEAEVERLGFRTDRVAGSDRFETAVAVAAELPDHAMVLVADGRGFRDALIASAAAASIGAVVVLTDGATLPPATDALLASDPTRHLAIGPLAAAAAPGAERIVRDTASELSVRVADKLVPDAIGVSVAGLDGFADALAGAAHAAAGGSVLLLTTGAELSGAVAAELHERGTSLRRVTLYGGTASVSAAVADAISEALADR